jgi:hypothetical protein
VTARKQFLLRVDPELWKQLEAWAGDELRSVNSQVEFLLRDAVRKRAGGRRAGGEGRPPTAPTEGDPHG